MHIAKYFTGACPALPNLENGRISYAWLYDNHDVDWQMNLDQYGTYISFVNATHTCNPEYEISGASVRECTWYETWRPTQAPI